MSPGILLPPRRRRLEMKTAEAATMAVTMTERMRTLPTWALLTTPGSTSSPTGGPWWHCWTSTSAS
eukprot:5196737-Heterocapsa_arctica.AAC.2